MGGPVRAIGGGPYLAVAGRRKVDLVPRIPAPEKPHPSVETEGARTISGRKSCFVGHLRPLVAANLHRCTIAHLWYPCLFDSMIHSVIFDLDCTLADRHRSIDAYLTHFLAKFGDKLQEADPPAVRAVLGRADGNGYAAATRAADIVANLDWSGRRPRATAVDKHWHATFPGCAVAMDGAVDVLGELREEGLALGILTNGTVYAQEAKITHLGLDECVDAVVVSEAVGCKKPDPRVFEAILEALDADAEDAVYVGDHPVNDVQGAIDAGLGAIWMRGWQDWPADQAPAEFVVDRLAEVPPMLATF